MWRTSGSHWVYISIEGQAYEEAIAVKCIATSRRFHLYVMDVLSGALVVRARWVCEAAPF
jgi:hypothetical protein